MSIWGINVKFLDHKTYTDIITFNYNPSEQEIEGNLYQHWPGSWKRQNLRNRFSYQVNRVMIHGVLHLLNYNDKTKAEKSGNAWKRGRLPIFVEIGWFHV